MIRALLIDDQPPARDDLRDLLAAHRDLVVVGEAGTAGRARTLLALDNYDLVFLDIDLGHEESAFDLLPAMRPQARVIFVTGFDDYAVRAFEAEALDYLLKPVQPERLAKSLSRLRGPAVGSGGAVSPYAADSDLVPIKVGPVTRLLRREEIRLVAACENYTEVTLEGGERLLVRRTMQQWSEVLRGLQFARVHRSLIVNLAHILRVERGEEDLVRVHFRSGLPLEVSRRYVPELRAKQALWQAEGAPGRSAKPTDASPAERKPGA